MKTFAEVHSATSDTAFPRLHLFTDSNTEFVKLKLKVVSSSFLFFSFFNSKSLFVVRIEFGFGNDCVA